MGFYKSTLGIESPEPGEAPAATGQLKRMVEQIDLLLRKQLTTLVELAKLKVTETVELPAESLTTAMLKALAVTTAKLGEGAVTAAKLGSEAVETAKIKTGAVTGPKLGEGTVRQETGTTQSFLSWGSISETGAIKAGSGDYTFAKIGAGEYELKWKTAKGTGNYTLVVSCEGGELTSNVITESAKALIIFGHGSGLVSTAFSFVAVAAS